MERVQPALENPTRGVPELPEPDTSPCERCGGMCCSFRTMTIAYASLNDLDRDLELEQKVRSIIRRGIDGNLYRQSGDSVDMDWYTDGTHLWFDCNHLTDDGLCGIYEDRPDLCRDFECAVLRGETTLAEYKDAHEITESRDMDGVTEVSDVVADELRENNPNA